jgi:hypothetical protein
MMTKDEIFECLQMHVTPIKLQTFARKYGVRADEAKEAFEQLLQEGKIKTNGLYGSYRKYSAV